RSGHPVDLDHVVFPLDPLRGVVTALGLVILTVVPMMSVLVMAFVSAVLTVSLGLVARARTLMLPAVHVVPRRAVLLACLALVVMAVMPVVNFVVMVAVSVVLVAVISFGCDQVRRQELHAALGAAVRFLARHFGMHRADVRRLFSCLGKQ